MGQPVVVVAGEQPESGAVEAAAAFAAGAAAATAQDAEQTATAAAEVAVAAVEVADHAERDASSALEVAFDAQVEVAKLHARVDQVLADVLDAIANPVEVLEPEDPTAPEPVVVDAVHVEAPAGAITEPPKKKREKRTGWGSNAWWGNR